VGDTARAAVAFKNNLVRVERLEAEQKAPRSARSSSDPFPRDVRAAGLTCIVTSPCGP
jgi:hypothetical protein